MKLWKNNFTLALRFQNRLSYEITTLTYCTGASLVWVQWVHLHPLKFAMGAMHPSSGGLFVLRTENQGKLWGICGS